MMKASYQSISDADVGQFESLPVVATKEISRTITDILVYTFVFIISLVFYSYCIYVSLAPVKLFLEEEGWRRLATETKCSYANVAAVTVVGAVVGLAAIGGGFYVAGLSYVGPAAGGWFAANMGAGLASGSYMALAQSAAMVAGGTYATGVALGAVSGAAACM